MDPRGIGYLIKSINDKLEVKADERLKDSGLIFSQSRVLAYLNMHDGQIYPALGESTKSGA